MPHHAAGMRMEPPWSPPMAMSTAPLATRAALPLERVAEALRDERSEIIAEAREKLQGFVTAVAALTLKLKEWQDKLLALIRMAVEQELLTVKG